MFKGKCFFASICVVLCFAFISIGGLEGDSRPVFSIQPAGVQVLPGETFTVSLYLDPANYGMKGANVVLKFNPTLLKARSITDGELGNEGTAKRRGLSLLNNNKGIIRIQVKKKPPLKPPLKPGAISDITFQVPAGTPMGSCDVTIFKAVFRTDSGRKIEDTVKEHLTVNIVAFKKAKILMNRFTKIPKKISGLQVYPSKLREGAVKLSQHNTEAVFKDFIGKNRQLLKIQPENLEMKPSRMLNKNRLVKFRQLYKGIPVYHSSVSMTAGESGKLLSYDTNYHTGITVPVKPKIAFKKALKIAAKSFRGLKVKSLRRKKSDTSASKLIIYPDKKNKTYHLAWHFLFSGSRPNPDVDTYFIIDAVKGNILHSYKRYSPARISGTLKGDIYPVNPTAPAVAARPLAHAYVEIPGSARKTTNSSGYFNSDSISSGTKTVTFNLEGPYAHVQDNGGVDFTTTKGCSGGSSCNFTWTAADEDGLNVFYHINVLRNWYRDWIGYTWVNHWTNTAQFRAEVNRRFDNAYAGDPMLFGINAYARSSDIIYHECSHNVLYKLYGDWVGFSVGSFIEGYAFDEGFADYFACAATNDGMLGEGSGSGRNLDNNHMYPGKAAYNIEGHTGGMIISGAAWDLRGMFIEQMGETTGSRFADRLIFDAHQVMSNLPREYFFSDPGESNFLTSLYTADDDNSNLADGVPHFNEIHRAFANHDLLQAVLHSGNSYDVSANQLGFYSGGDFYVAGSGKFYANNLGQRGIRSLGNIGNGPLEDVDIPTAGYTRFGVPIAVGHTYVSKAQQGEEGSFIVFRVSAYDAGSGDVTIRYFYHSGSLRLNNKDSYDFSAKIRKRITGGDFYLSGLKFWANNVDQGAVQDLGNLGRTALERVDIPSDNYSRQGVPVVRDHTYVARAGGGERAFIVFRVLGISGDSISIQYIYKKGNLITLYDRDSYDFKLKSRGSLSGGDFYFSGGKFFANNQGQKGLISLGNQGRTLLADVSIPKTGYTRFGVTPVVGHTYVALARRSGNYVVFKVTAFNNNSVTVDYLYLDMALSLVDGDSYDFSLKKKGKYSGGDFYFSGGKFLANNVGQRGVIDLGNLGRTTLKNVTIPSRGYTRFGVVAITGNTYVVQAGQDEEGNFIVLKVLEVDNEKISIEYLYVEVAVTLENGQSYDFSKRKKARYSGGDVYYSSGKFYCNNTGQRGALDLGNQGRTALKNVIIPSSGYNRFGVDAVAGHTYAVLAQQGEEGYVIVFKILSFSGDTVTLEYLYKAVM